MDAMILAAGLGTRLRPLSDHMPKALIEVGGTTMLERIARRLIAAGADRIVVNVHPHAEAIERFTARLAGELGIEMAVSREPDGPLETGGGLLHAAPLFRREEPFFLHNVDIVTDLDLAAMRDAHRAARPLATLAVHRRPTARRLLFDGRGLYGRTDEAAAVTRTARDARGRSESLAFAGVHVVAPEIFDLVTERGAFSILDVYLRLAGEGRRVLPFDVSGAVWLEIGTPERLARAREAIADG